MPASLKRRVKRRFLRVWNQLVPGALVLAYHRVTRAESDPQLLTVRPEWFAEQLEVLKRRCRPMSLSALLAAHDAGSGPRHAVVLTFDDGYADNLLEAKPLLERADIPATVFVTGRGEPSAAEFYWDELERIFLLPGTLPASLRLSVGGRVYQSELGESARYAQQAWERNKSWSVLSGPAPTVRHRLYQELCERLRVVSEGQRRLALEELRRWAGTTDAPRPSHRRMNADDVRALARGGLVEVGAHSLSHPRLSSLAPADQASEMRGSKAALEEILDHPVTSMAYPYGGPDDYDPRTVQLARDLGFRCACANFPGAVRGGTDRYQLPRRLVRDWNGDRFAEELGPWL